MVFQTKRSPYAILSAFSSDEPITVSEIVRRTGIPRTSVLRGIDICLADGNIKRFVVGGARENMYVSASRGL